MVARGETTRPRRMCAVERGPALEAERTTLMGDADGLLALTYGAPGEELSA